MDVAKTRQTGYPKSWWDYDSEKFWPVMGGHVDQEQTPEKKMATVVHMGDGCCNRPVT